MSTIKNVIIFYNELKDKNRQNLNIVLDYMTKFDVKVNVFTCINQPIISQNGEKDIFLDADLIITLGGDGTIIHASKYALKYDISIVGINMGYLGFLAQLTMDDLELLDELFILDKYQIDSRMVIEATIKSKNNNHKYYAVNDVVFARGESVRLVSLDLECMNKKVCSYRADGLIIATPSGSTAYSLSAGGPIVDYNVKSFIVTPICSHSLNSRPIVFSDEKVLKVISNSDLQMTLSVDGIDVYSIKYGDEIIIKKSDKSCKFINFGTRDISRIFDNPF